MIKKRILVLILISVFCLNVRAEDISLTYADKSVIATLVCAETENEPFLCKVALAALVINRIESPAFPDEADAVVWQKGAFPSVSSGKISEVKSGDEYDRAYRAVEAAASGIDPTSGALYFCHGENNGEYYIHPTLKAGNMIFGNIDR